MNALELKVLKYINKKDTVSETDIINHFRRTSNIAIKGVLFVLQNQYDYIRESNSIYEILCEIVPSNRQKYSDNFSLYREQLENLDSTFSSLVSSSDSKVLLFADRFPFAYFAKDYSLECYSLSDNCSENFYVTQKQIDFLAQKLNKTNLNALIILDQSTKDYARKVILQAEKPRCDIFEMDSLQTSSLRNAFNDKTYIYAMQKNLETITKCLMSK